MTRNGQAPHSWGQGFPRNCLCSSKVTSSNPSLCLSEALALELVVMVLSGWVLAGPTSTTYLMPGIGKTYHCSD